MSVSPTKRYRGTVTACTFTPTYPTSASAITLTGLKSMKFDAGLSIKTEAADGDYYQTACFADHEDPGVSFESIDPYMVSSIVSSQRGTLAFTVSDAANGTAVGGGGKTYSITNAYLKGVNIDHAFREFGKGSVTFGCISADGTTSPVTFASL